jgi:hypothetical protein
VGKREGEGKTMERGIGMAYEEYEKMRNEFMIAYEAFSWIFLSEGTKEQ